jgi:ATP-binding cassette subfamily B protein
MELVKVFGVFFPFVTLLSGTTTLIVLWVGGGKVIAGTMSPGELAAFLSYLGMLIWPIMSMGFTVNSLQRGAASMKRINEIFDAEPTIKAPVLGKELNLGADPVIRVEGLSFSYTENTEVSTTEGTEGFALSDISFTVPRGTVFGIFGRTGSGKSTLLKCFTRLVDVPPEMVSVGAVDVTTADLTKLRQAFGVVPQDTYLFSDSIKNNIGYSVSSVTQNSVSSVVDPLHQAAEVAALSKDLESFSDGWDTVVGERGLTLSGGQKQRTAIARALATEPEILIMDDSMSAVDIDTEERILGALLEARKGRTTILVSHRISTMSHADRIAVLDDGRLAEIGTPGVLLGKEGGLFRGAAELQKGF